MRCKYLCGIVGKIVVGGVVGGGKRISGIGKATDEGGKTALRMRLAV
nr:hypothetical protein [Staphylococcus pasteuri]